MLALRREENKTLLLPADLDYKPLTVSSVNVQIIDIMKLNRSMIAGILNLPSHIINDLEKATYSAILLRKPSILCGISIMALGSNW